MSRLLLDTEVLIWWDANDRRLGPKARVHIERASDVFVSAASAWEIVIKIALGKLRTTRIPSEAVVDGGFQMLPVTFGHAEAVRGLPPRHHDPFDRLILSTALVEGLTIVTSDGLFSRYDVPLIDAHQ